MMVRGDELVRRHDWTARLDVFLRARMNEPFRWGTNDCCTFAAGAVAAVTWIDFRAKLDIDYHSAIGARAVMKTLTGTSMIANAVGALPEKLGFQRRSVQHAMRGDLVLIKRARAGPALGIISLDARYAVAPGRFGLARVPRSQCIASWRVG